MGCACSAPRADEDEEQTTQVEPPALLPQAEAQPAVEAEVQAADVEVQEIEPAPVTVAQEQGYTTKDTEVAEILAAAQTEKATEKAKEKGGGIRSLLIAPITFTTTYLRMWSVSALRKRQKPKTTKCTATSKRCRTTQRSRLLCIRCGPSRAAVLRWRH